MGTGRQAGARAVAESSYLYPLAETLSLTRAFDTSKGHTSSKKATLLILSYRAIPWWLHIHMGTFLFKPPHLTHMCFAQSRVLHAYKW